MPGAHPNGGPTVGRALAATVFLFALSAAAGSWAAEALKDAADGALRSSNEAGSILTPGPAGGGLNIAREYEGYLPDVVFFPSAPPPPPSPFKQKMAAKKGLTLVPEASRTVFGRLYQPPGEGPFPAVVLLHGSWGVWDWNDVWALRLRDWGYLVLDLDSLTPRGLYPHNSGFGETAAGEPRRLIGAFVRSQDAHGARAFLGGLPQVQSDRIGLLGMSQGGQTAMHAIARKRNPNLEGRFQAAVALYPSCNPFSGFDAPLLVLIGSDDEWTGHGYCEDYLARAQTDHGLTFKVYDGAAHGFDFDGGEQRVFGLPLRHDPDAAEDAIARIEAFLAAHLKGAPETETQ